MALITATPRPDILLTILQDVPKWQHYIAWDVLPVFHTYVSTAPLPRVLRRSRIERLTRARYGGFPRSQLEVASAGTYNCVESGMEEQYDQKDIEIFKGEDRVQKWSGMAALNNLLLAHENDVQASLMTTATFGSGFNLAGAGTWGGGSDKPLNDVADARDLVLKNSGQDINTLVIGAGLYTKLKKSTQIQNQIRAIAGYQNMEAGIQFDIDAKLLATAFGIDRVLIGRARQNTADDGQTASMAYLWPSDKALACYIPDPSDDTAPHLGRTFVWDNGLMELGNQAQIAAPFEGTIIETYADQFSNTGIVRARKFTDKLLLNKESGALITGI